MNSTKKLINPRGYISWTQYSIFIQSPEKYYKKYILGEDQFTTKEMYFGKSISNALELDEETGDLFTDMVVSRIPKLPLREFEIKANLNTPKGEVVLLGKLDAFCDKAHIIREYKTGKQPWTQTRADKHGQIMFYSLLVWLQYKKVPTEVWLDWAVTENGDDGDIRFTGELHSFKVNVKIGEIINFMAKVANVSVAIDQMYRKHLGLN